MQLDITGNLSVAQRNVDDLANILVGASPRIQFARVLIAKLAANYSTVLITGESGTGKELAARAVHELSARQAGPLFR